MSNPDNTKSPVIESSVVLQAIRDEQLTGECPPELLAASCVDMESFIAYTAQVVWATKLSIAQRLGFELPCPCSETACTGQLSPGCGMTDTLRMVDMTKGETEQPWKRDDDMTLTCLSLIGGTEHITAETIAGWSDDECQKAEEYAIAVHYQASDNDAVEVPPKPAVLEVSREAD